MQHLWKARRNTYTHDAWRTTRRPSIRLHRSSTSDRKQPVQVRPDSRAYRLMSWALRPTRHHRLVPMRRRTRTTIRLCPADLSAANFLHSSGGPGAQHLRPELVQHLPGRHRSPRNHQQCRTPPPPLPRPLEAPAPPLAQHLLLLPLSARALRSAHNGPFLGDAACAHAERCLTSDIEELVLQLRMSTVRKSLGLGTRNRGAQ